MQKTLFDYHGWEVKKGKRRSQEQTNQVKRVKETHGDYSYYLDNLIFQNLTFSNVPRHFRENKEFVIDVLKCAPWETPNIPLETIPSGVDFYKYCLSAFEHDWITFDDIPKQLQEDKDFMMSAIRRNPENVWIPKIFHMDRDVIQLAIKNEVEDLNFIKLE